ncbi:MAG: bifunctional 2-keto-4-hydroxyglutarate aldolase/2-keto-3-deoxy-6-phosphogluconate aldolase [Christensenella sp.]
MQKSEVLKRLEECGVIAVVRGNNEEDVMKIIDACIAGGIVGIEVTFTVPGAVDIIKALAKRYDPKDVLIGAGTVLDPETARAAILAGAQFVVAPCLNVDTVKMCLRYQIACMPGAMTIKETVDCMEAGADIVKLFPGSLGGPSMIKNIKGPLPQVKIMPTGGVNAKNAGEWIAAGAVAVGAGGDLTAGAKTGDYASITAVGKEMIAAVKAARK